MKKKHPVFHQKKIEMRFCGLKIWTQASVIKTCVNFHPASLGNCGNIMGAAPVFETNWDKTQSGVDTICELKTHSVNEFIMWWSLRHFLIYTVFLQRFYPCWFTNMVFVKWWTKFLDQAILIASTWAGIVTAVLSAHTLLFSIDTYIWTTGCQPWC